MTRLFIKADKQGHILSVAKVDSLHEGQQTPFEDDPEADIVEITDAEGKGKYIDMEPIEIHEGYVLDPKKLTLKKKKAF